MSNVDLIKSIRARTNLSYRDIHKAIEHLGVHDEEVIISYMREQGILKSQARQDRDTNQGGIFSYIHEYKLGVMVEIKCETDFVSRGEVFRTFGMDIALHIAANQPKSVSEADMNQDFLDKELAIARELLINQNKPEQMLTKILEGKKASIIKDFSLLTQPYLKNPDITVADYISHISQETGEKVVITKFIVFSLES